MIYTLTIPGEPVTKARPRVTQAGFTYTPAKTKNYETFVRELFYAEHGQVMMDGAIKAEIIAYFPIPKSTAKKLHVQMATEQYPHIKSRDADNVAKSVLDALNDVAYKDDCQIADLLVLKRYSELPRVTLALSKIEYGGEHSEFISEQIGLT